MCVNTTNLETIKSSDQISEILKTGKRFSNKYVTFIIQKSDHFDSTCNTEHGHMGRVAFIAGKKLGNAVWRNKAKRRLREICRAAGGPWTNLEVLFIAKKPLTEDTYSKVLDECNRTISRFK